VCALATFFKVDVLTIASLFGTETNVRAPMSLRDAFIILFILFSFVLSGFGFLSNKSERVPRLTRNQKRILREAARIRTLMRDILISITNANSATEPLAHDLGEVFNSAGIAPWFVHASPDNPSHSGLRLCIRDLNNPPPATEDLKSVLRLAKIPFTMDRFPTSGFSGSTQNVGADNDLVIWSLRHRRRRLVRAILSRRSPLPTI
jgi:hypothetical protein